MRRVDFLIVGAQKAGTSVLDHYLRQHPEIGMANKKELHFFDNEKLFSRRDVDYYSYEKCFRWQDDKKVYGESTPIYMYWQPSCKRIWEYNKNIKLIAILRNPVERAFSHWNMEFSRKKETLEFEEAIKNEQCRSRESLPHQHRVYSYIDRGFYSEQIRRLRKFFMDDQLLFLKYEEFKGYPDKALKEIFEFLGVSKEIDIVKAKIHSGNYTYELPNKVKEYILNIYDNDIFEVEKMLNWNCSDWRL